MQTRLRLAYFCAALLIVALGLACRSKALGLPWPVAKYSGSILWGSMVYFIVAFVIPGRRIAAKCATAAIIATLVELIRLYHCPWLDDFRRTLPGQLLLGTHFSLWDILAYWIGIAAAALSERLLSRGRSTLS